MKTLIYIGANKGDSLYGYLSVFDKIYVFEPNPEVYEVLKNRFGKEKNVILINAACSLEDGVSDFYVTHKDPCSSFFRISEEYPDLSLRNLSKKITVTTVNLRNFLNKENIDYIDHYVSDIQGFDFEVLTTIKDFIDKRKIKSLFVETHSDKAKIYENSNNGFSNFKQILENNYKVKFFSFDGVFVPVEDLSKHEGISAMEWDTYWELK